MPEKYKRAVEMLTICNISLLCDPSIMTLWPLHTASDNVKISDLMMYLCLVQEMTIYLQAIYATKSQPKPPFLKVLIT